MRHSNVTNQHDDIEPCAEPVLFPGIPGMDKVSCTAFSAVRDLFIMLL